MKQRSKTRWLPMFTLVVVSTLMAELLSGSTPFSRFNQILPQFLMYGCGALVIREVTRRLGLGWATIILLGFAFGLTTEGLVLQSLFNPNFLHLDIAFGRAAGVNWVWAEYLTGLHAFWSITGSILFCEVIFPAERNIPWVGRTGFWISAVLYVLICVAFHFLFIKIFGFKTAPRLLLFCALLIIGVIVLALQLPVTKVGKDLPVKGYAFFVLALLTFAAGALWFLGIHMVFAPQKVAVWWALAAGILDLLVYFILVRYWDLAAVRTDKDRLAVAAGLLCADLLLGYTGTLDNRLDHYGQILLIFLTLIVLFVLFRRPVKQQPVI